MINAATPDASKHVNMTSWFRRSQEKGYLYHGSAAGILITLNRTFLSGYQNDCNRDHKFMKKHKKG
jgi:hypothetical protein